MNIIVLQHIKIEDPGYIKDLMIADGFNLTTIELDEGEKIPSDLKRFMVRFIDKLKDKKLTRQRQKAVLYKVVKGLGISPQELMMYVQKVKKGL